MIGLALNDYLNEQKEIRTPGELLIPIIISVLITLLFIIIRLNLIIDGDGVHVKLFPFHFSYRTFRWNEIEKIYVRKYKPISEYGGWGLKGYRNNRAINLSGDMGLQLELKSGKKVLIGTVHAEELSQFIQKQSGRFIPANKTQS